MFAKEIIPKPIGHIFQSCWLHAQRQFQSATAALLPPPLPPQATLNAPTTAAIDGCGSPSSFPSPFHPSHSDNVRNAGNGWTTAMERNPLHISQSASSLTISISRAITRGQWPCRISGQLGNELLTIDPERQGRRRRRTNNSSYRNNLSQKWGAYNVTYWPIITNNVSYSK